MIAVKDPRGIPANIRLPRSAQPRTDRDALAIRVPHECLRRLRFDPLQFVVNRRDGDIELLKPFAARRVDTAVLAEHDRGHQPAERREQQRLLVLQFGVLVKQPVNGLGVEQSPQHQLPRRRHRPLRGKTLKHRIRKHRLPRDGLPAGSSDETTPVSSQCTNHEGQANIESPGLREFRYRTHPRIHV